MALCIRMAQTKHGVTLAHPASAMETVGRACLPEDIALRRKHKSKWGLQVMSEFDIPASSNILRGHRPSSTKRGDALVLEALSQEDTDDAMNIIKAWKDSMKAASSCDAKLTEDVKDAFENVREPDIINFPRYPAYITAAKEAEIHNLWHPDQFTEAKAGYVTCTLCGITLSSGQQATHGRGRRHSLKAWRAAKKPIAQCRGFKWCCWYGCSCRRWLYRSD
jgi:hypothetical protein